VGCQLFDQVHDRFFVLFHFVAALLDVSRNDFLCTEEDRQVTFINSNVKMHLAALTANNACAPSAFHRV
jgi:hypothetical protein